MNRFECARGRFGFEDALDGQAVISEILERMFDCHVDIVAQVNLFKPQDMPRVGTTVLRVLVRESGQKCFCGVAER